MARVSSNIRSGPSRKVCYLRFINNTCRKVNVIWIDYHGGNRNFGTLEPQRYFDIHTYEGHPWISEDSVSKKRMMLNKMDIYYPKPPNSIRSVPRGPNRSHVPVLYNKELKRGDTQLKRERVAITLPVFPLKSLAMDAIIKSVRKREDLKRLRLPKRLVERLWKSYFPH